MRKHNRTRAIKIAVALAVILVISAGCRSLSPAPKKKYNVVAYVAGYRDFDFTTIQATKITHINYAFANVIDGEVRFDTSIDNTPLKKDDIFKLHALKKIISYENARSIAFKMQYLQEKALGGAMFWEYSDDHEGELLDALDRTLAERRD